MPPWYLFPIWLMDLVMITWSFRRLRRLRAQRRALQALQMSQVSYLNQPPNNVLSLHSSEPLKAAGGSQALTSPRTALARSDFSRVFAGSNPGGAAWDAEVANNPEAMKVVDLLLRAAGVEDDLSLLPNTLKVAAVIFHNDDLMSRHQATEWYRKAFELTL